MICFHIRMKEKLSKEISLYAKDNKLSKNSAINVLLENGLLFEKLQYFRKVENTNEKKNIY